MKCPYEKGTFEYECWWDDVHEEARWIEAEEEMHDELA